MRVDRQGVTGVVIEPGEDLAVLARAKRVVGVTFGASVPDAP
jgi:hypothetical protein